MSYEDREEIVRPRVHRMIRFAPVFLVGAAVFVTLGGVIVRALWNWLLPTLFGWPAITFWQALGLLLLCRILLGGFGIHGGRRWSREERDRFRQAIHRRYGSGPAADEGPTGPATT